MSVQKKLPRTQAQRSAHTKERLCEATIQALCEVGYDRVSTQMIARKAQVSRGAQSHHFPTKNDILVAAFEYLLKEWEAHRLEFLKKNEASHLGIDDYLDYLWDNIFNTPRYIAALELMLAARMDPQLSQRLRISLGHWAEIRDALWGQVTGLTPENKDNEVFLNLNLCVLRGMATHTSFNRDESINKLILERWKSIIRAILQE